MNSELLCSCVPTRNFYCLVADHPLDDTMIMYRLVSDSITNVSLRVRMVVRLHSRLSKSIDTTRNSRKTAVSPNISLLSTARGLANLQLNQLGGQDMCITKYRERNPITRTELQDSAVFDATTQRASCLAAPTSSTILPCDFASHVQRNPQQRVHQQAVNMRSAVA